jgi:hypothetical protein
LEVELAFLVVPDYGVVCRVGISSVRDRQTVFGRFDREHPVVAGYHVVLRLSMCEIIAQTDRDEDVRIVAEHGVDFGLMEWPGWSSE